jgi:hypothetical protein
MIILKYFPYKDFSLLATLFLASLMPFNVYHALAPYTIAGRIITTYIRRLAPVL